MQVGFVLFSETGIPPNGAQIKQENRKKLAESGKKRPGTSQKGCNLVGQRSKFLSGENWSKQEPGMTECICNPGMVTYLWLNHMHIIKHVNKINVSVTLGFILFLVTINVYPKHTNKLNTSDDIEIAAKQTAGRVASGNEFFAFAAESISLLATETDTLLKVAREKLKTLIKAVSTINSQSYS